MAGYTLRARQLLTMSDAFPSSDLEAARVGLIEDGCVVSRGGTITWVGPWSERPSHADELPMSRAEVALPALVECHTHSLFAGARYEEFAVRNAGGSYAEILESGGGILSTMAATRAADEQLLEALLRERMEAFATQGCALVEVKTGYGLSHDEELRQLRLLERVRKSLPVELVVTYLGAHAIPPEYRANREAYVQEICQRTIPVIVAEELADAIDVFCDRGAFTAEESHRILRTGRDAGLEVRIHTDELSTSGGCQVASALGAKSADHLEYATDQDLDALAKADVAAVLLPAVTGFLAMPPRPRARDMAARGIRLALSTDYNPGSAHCQNLLLMATLGCTLYKMTPGEALRALTRVPAEVLGKENRFGQIAAGYDARIVTAALPSWRALPYDMAPPEPLGRIGF